MIFIVVYDSNFQISLNYELVTIHTNFIGIFLFIAIIIFI